MELMMTKAILEAGELISRNIVDLLSQLNLVYKNSKAERQEIVVEFPGDEDDFLLLEEIELLTVNIRGYASQIQLTGKIENKMQALENLQAMRVFNIPVIASFYFGTDGKYPQMKDYIRMLDYLRLLILEYINNISA
jgi:hypothetical protein